MEGLRPPPELHFAGNADTAWRVFRQRFELFEAATAPSTGRSDEQKLSLLLHAAGQEAIDVFNTFVFTTTAAKSYANTVAKFETYCTPKKNETYERLIFRDRMQKKDEGVDQYVVDLRLKAKSCNFGQLEDSLIRDQIVYGVRDLKIRRTLLAEENLTLNRAIQLCQATEAMQVQMKNWSEGPKTETVDAVTRNQDSYGKRQSGARQEKHVKPIGDSSHRQQDRNRWSGKTTTNCQRCKRRHERNKCPADGKICNRCGKRNHFAAACKATDVDEVQRETDSEDDFVVDAVESRHNKTDWIIPITINGVVVPCKLDTGAQVNLLPMEYYEKMAPKPKKQHTTVRLSAYGGSKIKTHGEIHAVARVKSAESITKMVLVGYGERPILCRETCVRLGLVRLIYEVVEEAATQQEPEPPEDPSKYRAKITSEYPTVFKGIGRLRTTCKIRLKENAIPVIVPPRRIPYSLREKLKSELDRLERRSIIRKVNEPTQWVSPLVIREKKDGSLRLCLDPKTLNENILREHYQLPTKEEIEAELAGAEFFTKLDAASGFYQIPLDRESQLLTTFNTPYGRYCFNRLPFGIASAPEIFFKHFSQIFETVPGARPLHDDVIVWGRSGPEHDKNLREALARLKRAKATLNVKKCIFRVPEVTYMGEIISKGGVKPDPRKIEAIVKMPTPTTQKEVQRALGVVNFVGKYIPNLSAHTTHLRSLRKQNVDDQNISTEHHEEWNHIKSVLTQSPILQFYDPKKETKVSTDASKDGLGAVLMQRHGDNWCPVAYASRTLTPAETRYAQIEKESLGIVFGCQKFHNYIYGKELILETDHKPLVSMANRVLAEVPPRLQRLFLKLMKYQYKIVFTPGKSLILADALSRASLPALSTEDKNTFEDVEVHINSVITTLPVSRSMLDRVRQETEKDEELQNVLKQIHQGWTRKNEQTSAYASVQDELTEAEGLVLKGFRIVVPRKMRAEMLNIIHDGHLGIEKCRRRARRCLYWPNMNKHIEDQCKRCSTCNTFQYAQHQEPYITRETPDKPWDTIGTDIFHNAGTDYLVVVDAYSTYIEVEALRTTSAKAVIACLKRTFGRHGIPRTVMSDNMPFSSREFQEFAERYDFVNITSSPEYPQSNGLAEKGVQIAKRILKKAINSDEDFHLGLLSFRNTPLDHGKSPAELLMGRTLRTRLPEVESKLPGNKMTRKKQQQRGPELPPLYAGNVVRILDQKGTWRRKAQVIREVAPRSYEVELEEGGRWRRNRRSLRLVKEPFRDKSNEATQKRQNSNTSQSTKDESLIYRLPTTRCSTPVRVSGTARTQPPARAPDPDDEINPEACTASRGGPLNIRNRDVPARPPVRRSQRNRKSPDRLIMLH